ncbi:MAG: DUF4129 domain-containing protein [Bacteroidota bacterium]
MSRLYYILFFLLLNPFWLSIDAQEVAEVRIDSSQTNMRSFDEDLSQKYSGNDFNYESSVEGESQNFIARALYWIIRKLSEVFGIEIDPTTYKIVEFILYGLLIVLAIYLVVRVLVGSKAAAFFTKDSRKLAPLNIQEEHIEQVDLDQFIKDALRQKNYRLAVRYLFLKALKQLSFRNLIAWHYDKTNLDYYHEIEHPELKERFKKLSYLYDYVWYGEFDLDATGFENAQTDFERFNKKMDHAG